MTINHPPIQSSLPFLKSGQVHDQVDFNFINNNQLNFYPNHCQFYEYDNFDRNNPLNNENHLQNYHFLQFECNSGDLFPNDVNLLLHYQQQQHQRQRQESSMPSPPSTSTSRFTEPDQIKACNLYQFSSNPAILDHNMQSIPRTQPTHPSHPAQSISQLRLQTITPELEKISSFHPIPSLNSSPISHSSSISFDQIHHLDINPNLDEFNPTLLHQSQPLQSPLSPHQYNFNLHSHLNSFEALNSNPFDQNRPFQAHLNPPIPNQFPTNSHPKTQTRIKSSQESQYKTKLQTQRTKPNQSQVQPEKKYGCLICNKHFARAFNLQTHIATHKGIKPFKCPTPNCSKSFSRRHDLSRHLNSLHSNWLNSLKVNSNQIVSKLKLDDHDKLLFKTCSNFFQI